jgi:hypothetical protein
MCNPWYSYDNEGKHKDHDVKLMKKALNQVKGNFLSIINLVSESQNTMSKHKESFLKFIKDANDRNTQYKATISK